MRASMLILGNGRGMRTTCRCRVRAHPLEGFVDDLVGQLFGTVGKEGAEDAVELTLVHHRGSSPATATGRSSASTAARIARWA